MPSVGAPPPERILVSPAQPDTDNAVEEEVQGVSLHPEIQIPPEEAEDVTFLSELQQSESLPDNSVVLPVVSNDRIDTFIELFQGPQRRWMERALGRSGRYAQRMKEILREFHHQVKHKRLDFKIGIILF